MSRLLWLVLVTLVVMVTGALSAVAQTNGPLAGLPQSAIVVAQAIDGGRAGQIEGYLSTASVTKTAYPGNGEAVPHETAVADVSAAVVSNPGENDDQGTGQYRLLAVWIPTADPSGVYLVGSGIDASGTRITTVFTVKDGAIVAYGRAADTSATLAQFAKDGDLRMVSAGSVIPAAPTVGTGAARSAASDGNLLVIAGIALWIVSVTSFGTWRACRAHALS